MNSSAYAKYEFLANIVDCIITMSQRHIAREKPNYSQECCLLTVFFIRSFPLNMIKNRISGGGTNKGTDSKNIHLCLRPAVLITTTNGDNFRS